VLKIFSFFKKFLICWWIWQSIKKVQFQILTGQNPLPHPHSWNPGIQENSILRSLDVLVFHLAPTLTLGTQHLTIKFLHLQTRFDVYLAVGLSNL
jgi:hypothetical protein